MTAQQGSRAARRARRAEKVKAYYTTIYTVAADWARREDSAAMLKDNPTGWLGGLTNTLEKIFDDLAKTKPQEKALIREALAQVAKKLAA